jgi:hypothetical protein
MREFLKILVKKILAETFADKIIYVMLLLIMLMAFLSVMAGMGRNIRSIQELQRSHEAMEQRLTKAEHIYKAIKEEQLRVIMYTNTLAKQIDNIEPGIPLLWFEHETGCPKCH